MSNIFKYVIVLFLAAFFGGLYILLSFSGVFDKKYSEDELVSEFIDHESEFADLEAFFISVLPKDNLHKVSFGLGRRDRVSLEIYPIVISPANKIIGGDDLKIGSPKLDSALMLLGWTNETLKNLRDKLSKTNCDWITRASQRNVISIYPRQSGWGKYTYVIYEKPIVDSLITLYGKPIGNSQFGKRVVLNYHAAL